MTAQQTILLFGTVTLMGCGSGLVLIHDSNPLLKGLNCMGGALVVGGAAAALTLTATAFPAIEPAANFFVLAAFMCCYRADRYLIGLEAGPNRLAKVLLGVQGLTAILQWAHIIGTRGATTVVSALIAAQLLSTSELIRRNAPAKIRLITRCTVAMMRLLALANVARGGASAMGLLTQQHWSEALNLLTYNVFVAAAIGLAFAFFWRTTAKLSLELEHMASTDPLTRVYNRRVFLQWCESEQARSRRSGVPFSLLMLDFDHFKRINDTFGHHVGDRVLCSAVERIQDSVRGIDVLCRWGGEEFTVLLPNASEQATCLVAERIRQNIRGMKSADPQFASEEFAQLQLSASIGTATYLGEEDNVQLMLQRADAALYEAKGAGRNRVVLSTALLPPKEACVPSALVLEPH